MLEYSVVVEDWKAIEYRKTLLEIEQVEREMAMLIPLGRKVWDMSRNANSVSQADKDFYLNNHTPLEQRYNRLKAQLLALAGGFVEEKKK